MSEQEQVPTRDPFTVLSPTCLDVGHEFLCRFDFGSCRRCIPSDECRCWTCGQAVPKSVFTTLPREPEPHGDKRTCEECHYAIEALPDPLRFMNMVRFVAGIPLVEAPTSGSTSEDGAS